MINIVLKNSFFKVITILSIFLFNPNIKAQKLIIGNNVWPGCGIMYLAEKKGFFKDAGLEIEMKMYDDYIESINAFKRGEIDIIQEDIFSCVYTALEGIAFISVIPTVDNLGFDELMAQQNISSVKELKGKKVAYSPGSVGHFLLQKALESNGLRESDIIPVSAGFKEVEILFNEKKIDCGVCHFYNRPSGNVLYSTRDYNLPNLLMVKQDKYVKQYEDIVKIIEVWQRAIKYFNENEKESLLIMQEQMEVDNEKLMISLMKRAPIIDLNKDAENLYGDNGSIFFKINDILSFIETNKDTEENIRKECKFIKSHLNEIFNNSIIKTKSFFKENNNENYRLGLDYAYFFATDNYADENWKNLRNPIRDAKAIAEILNNKYGFFVKVYEDLTLDSISYILKKISAKDYNTGDQLFIFFAGHGYFDEDDKEGYIVLKNSIYDDISNKSYYSFSKLTSLLDKTSCSHVLLVLDVCYSGTIFKDIALKKGNSDVYSNFSIEKNLDIDYKLLNEVLNLKTRKALTAGGKIEVADGVKHSPFAFRLLEALNYGADETRILTINALKSFCETQYPYPKLEDFAPSESKGDFLFILK